MSVVSPLLTVHTTEPSSFLEYRGSDRVAYEVGKAVKGGEEAVKTFKIRQNPDSK